MLSAKSLFLGTKKIAYLKFHQYICKFFLMKFIQFIYFFGNYRSLYHFWMFLVASLVDNTFDGTFATVENDTQKQYNFWVDGKNDEMMHCVRINTISHPNSEVKLLSTNLRSMIVKHYLKFGYCNTFFEVTSLLPVFPLSFVFSHIFMSFFVTYQFLPKPTYDSSSNH